MSYCFFLDLVDVALSPEHMSRPPPEAPPCAPPCAPPITPPSPGPGAPGWDREVVCIQPSRSTSPPESLEPPPEEPRNVSAYEHTGRYTGRLKPRLVSHSLTSQQTGIILEYLYQSEVSHASDYANIIYFCPLSSKIELMMKTFRTTIIDHSFNLISLQKYVWYPFVELSTHFQSNISAWQTNCDPSLCLPTLTLCFQHPKHCCHGNPSLCPSLECSSSLNEGNSSLPLKDEAMN